MSDDETFEQADAGSSDTYPVSAGNLKKGDCVVIKGRPCKIVDISTSKTGKHGHAKANITALDIFNGKKYEEVAPTSHNLPAPFIKTNSYQLLDISHDGVLSLMDDEGATREDLNLPADEELAAKLKEAFESGKTTTVVVTAAMGMESVMSLKTEGQ
jgi:translation initiation factor 5A